MYPRIRDFIAGLFGENENAYYTKIKPLLKANFKGESFHRISSIGGCEFREGLQEELVNAIREGTLVQVMEANPFNTQTDDIELYYLEGEKNKVLLIMDHFEVFDYEHILGVEESNLELKDFPESEVIYESPTTASYN